MSGELSHLVRGTILEIKLKDESCDATNSLQIREKVLELITKTGCSKVVIDLSHIQFIDSSGLGTFLAIQRSLYGEGGKLKLACLTKQVQAVFEIVSMHRIFDVYPTLDDAMKSF